MPNPCKRSESSANKAARLLRAVFNHAADHYTDEKGERLFSDNPVKELSSKKAWSKEQPRLNRIAEADRERFRVELGEKP